jgi:hypothetical protein
MTDPPSVERKNAGSWEWARDLRRNLVNRRALMVAIRTLALAARVIELLKRLFGDF